MNAKRVRANFFYHFITALLVVVILTTGFVPVSSLRTNTAFAAAFVDEKIDAELAKEMNGLPLNAPLEVVLVFEDTSAAPKVAGLAAKFFQMKALPMAGAILTKAQIQEIAGWAEIHSITLNSSLEYFLAESVPLIRADQVWTTYGQTGGNTTVAVIDSGVDASHPDLPLGSKVIENVKILPYEIALEDQLITDTSSGHGTHVAGTIGGTGAFSGGYYKGVAPDVKIVGLGAGEALSILTAIQAYDWVLQHHEEYGIRLVSNSWGSSGGIINVRNPIVIATYEGYKKGILSVFAASNDGGYDVMNPYSLAPWVLSVAAGGKDGSLAEFSSRGKDGDYFKHPDITAPGVDIYAARSKTIGITALDPMPNPVNPEWTAIYTKMSGTSMATPHVSGALALLVSGKPKLSPDQLIDLIISTARPMPGYMLHEVGYGYMDILAAYEAGQQLQGNLDSFLAGDQQYSLEDVLGFDPDMSAPYDEYLYTGITPVGATEASEPIDHPFQVGEDALFVDILLTWTPQLEDAYDIEVIDPLGRIVVSSGNGLEEGEAAMFVPEMPGEYILRMHPFAAVASQYEARVKIAYGNQNGSVPPSTEPVYDYYLGLDAIFKTHGVLGIGSEHFRSGDRGFIDFKLVTGEGMPVTGVATSLQAIYTDRTGNAALVDNAISELGSGEYRSNFNTASTAWKGAAGPITVTFAWKGAETMRAVPTDFKLNHLETSLKTDKVDYKPGENVNFSGSVNQANDVATGNLELAPVGGAQVTVKLVDRDGNRLASTQVLTDIHGNYSGSLKAPDITRGTVTLVAEATYTDPTIVQGTNVWYGKQTVALNFPGNLAPEADLYATPITNERTKFYVHIEAEVSDPDGVDDIRSISVTLTDTKGRLLKRWNEGEFVQSDENTLMLMRAYRVSGKAPWTVTLTATDSAGNSVTTSTVINK